MNQTPSTQTELYGLKNEFNELVNLYLKNKLPNKILLSGQKGIGKCTLAYHLINYVLSKDEIYPYNFDKLCIDHKNHNFRLQNSYNFCINTGTGYLIYLKEKFNIEIPPVIKNFNKSPYQYWVFNRKNSKIRDENKLIILNKDNNFKVDTNKYKIIDNYEGRCFFLEKI